MPLERFLKGKCLDLLGISHKPINALQYEGHLVIREKIDVPELEFCDLHVIL